MTACSASIAWAEGLALLRDLDDHAVGGAFIGDRGRGRCGIIFEFPLLLNFRAITTVSVMCNIEP